MNIQDTNGNLIDADTFDDVSAPASAAPVVQTGFGPVAVTPVDDGGIPPFLQREHVEQVHVASEGNHGTTELEPSGESDGEAVANEAQVSNQDEAPINERATIGDNGAPLSPEEMRKEFERDINTLGKQSGVGSAALPRLGLRVIRAAADGLISTEKPKSGKSDAVIIYERYAAQDSKHAEHTAGGMKANAAKLNSLIGLGCMTTCDGVEVADRTVRLREEMEGAELKPKPLFAGLVDVARAQLDSDVALTDEGIKAALTKNPTEKTLEKEWTAINKKIEALVTGEGSHGLHDKSDAAMKIAELTAEHIRNFGADNSDKDMVLALMEKGHGRHAAENIVRPDSGTNGWSI